MTPRFPSGKKWSEGLCHDRHWWTNWAIGLMFSLLGLMVVMLGWAINSASCASSEAMKAVNRAESVETRATSDRDYIKENIGELKVSVQRMGEKQDRMNGDIQRLIQKTDTTTK